MTVVKELIRSELDGTLSFGDYTPEDFTKLKNGQGYKDKKGWI